MWTLPGPGGRRQWAGRLTARAFMFRRVDVQITLVRSIDGFAIPFSSRILRTLQSKYFAAVRAEEACRSIVLSSIPQVSLAAVDETIPTQN